MIWFKMSDWLFVTILSSTSPFYQAISSLSQCVWTRSSSSSWNLWSIWILGSIFLGLFRVGFQLGLVLELVSIIIPFLEGEADSGFAYDCAIIFMAILPLSPALDCLRDCATKGLKAFYVTYLLFRPIWPGPGDISGGMVPSSINESFMQTEEPLMVGVKLLLCLKYFAFWSFLTAILCKSRAS